MAIYAYYGIISFIVLALVLIGVVFYRKNTKAFSILLKVFSLVVGGCFLFRYMLGSDGIQNMFQLSNTTIDGKFWNFLALMLVWLTYSSSLLASLYGFFKVKLLNKFIKYLVLPISILNVIFLSLNFQAILGKDEIYNFSVRGILFAIEIGLVLALSIFVFIAKTDWQKIKSKFSRKKHKNMFDNLESIKEENNQNTEYKKNVFINQTNNVQMQNLLISTKNNKKTIKINENYNKNTLKTTNSNQKMKKNNLALIKFLKIIGTHISQFFAKYRVSIFCILIILFSTLPTYFLQGIFGYVHQTMTCKDLELPHRIILYIGIILPIVIHYSLKNESYDEKRFYLLFICLGTLLSFSFGHKFATFADPRNWPLHLCNTAMYIMPIVLIFNMKKFFYFTYFINVVGAFFAMMMPNYGDAVNMFSTTVVNFYVNHYIAFFMPILFVSLGMFQKPKFKQFVYSMLGFLGYFVLIIIVNALYNGLFEAGVVSSTTDFFFVNSDFIADKLGTWAENLMDTTATITINGINLLFYPIYQILFFIVYIGIGFAMWFIYEQGYQIADGLNEIRIKKQKIKVDILALQNHINGRSVKEPMELENKDKLILRNFSKKYSSSEVFAVENANLTVNGGEIFGFLGPNGAGKSTIIKSIVGIQPITSGQIIVCGYDVDTQSVEAKSQIGFVPDHYALYEKLTGREYVNYIADLYNVPIKERNERIESFIKRFELEGAIDNQMRTYSHGMKQKITIMSALVHNPKIWILDEPLTGLDPNSIYQVKECMKEHAKNGNIVFFSSHIIDVVEKICDKIAIIKKGHILLTKSVKEIDDSGMSLEEFYMQTINQFIDKKIENLTEVAKNTEINNKIIENKNDNKKQESNEQFNKKIKKKANKQNNH